MKTLRELSLCVALTILFVSCATVKKEKTAPLNGMIYDKDNKPVSEAVIQINGKTFSISDVYGHFTLTGLRTFQTYQVLVTKNGFEEVSLELVYSDPTQILYIRMNSAQQMIAEAETAIQAQDWQNAEELLARAEKIDGDKTATGYLKAVIAFKKGLFTESADLLIALLSNEKQQPFICLFLADIYEYRLSDMNKASEYLLRFLESRYDPDVESRLKKIEDKRKL